MHSEPADFVNRLLSSGPENRALKRWKRGEGEEFWLSDGQCCGSRPQRQHPHADVRLAVGGCAGSAQDAVQPSSGGRRRAGRERCSTGWPAPAKLLLDARRPNDEDPRARRPPPADQRPSRGAADRAGACRNRHVPAAHSNKAKHGVHLLSRPSGECEMAKIYVSYSTADKEVAERVVDGLSKMGHTVLWDDDILRAGLDWRVVLAQALRDCQVVVSVLTKNSVSASYPMSELGAARILGKTIVPLLFDNISYPNVVQDLYCVRVSDSNLDATLSRISRDLSHFATQNKKIFIVHGHNEAKKLELKDYLAGLALDPVILHQQNDLGKTIIEKFEYYASQCAFAVILLTPDDQAASDHESVETKWRARQNVIMELGWFMAKLGRDRVLLITQGNIQIPSDIIGVVYAPFCNSILEISETIRERLRSVGIL